MAPALLALGYALLGLAWVVGNPPGSAPDEPHHYLKALAAGRGQIVLRERPPPPPDPASLDTRQRWQFATSRVVRIPAELAPAGFGCNAFKPRVPAACLSAASAERGAGSTVAAPTHVATYQPFAYLPSGILMRLAGDAATALTLGRIAVWGASATFLALAVFLLWAEGRGGWALVGLMVGLTPLAVYVSSTLTANGIEIASGACFLAGLIRLSRGGQQDRWVWLALGAAGTALAASRVTGVLWLVLDLVFFVALMGAGPARALIRRHRRRAVLAAAPVTVAAAATVVWELAVQPRPARTWRAAVEGLPVIAGDLPDIVQEGIGIFGWADTVMTRPAYATWRALFIVVVALAFLVGSRRQRLLTGGLLVTATAAVFVIATLNRPTGFGVHARYVLPFVVVVPLFAGEVLLRNWSRMSAVRPTRLAPLVAVTVAVIHACGWYANARRAAVGTGGPLVFVGRSAWEPPLGWAPWLAVVVAAAAAIVSAAVIASRAPEGAAP